MRAAYQLGQVLKTIKSPNNNDRLARAMALVNAVAFAIPMTPGQSANDFVEASQGAFTRLLNDVNETAPVDVRLAKALFDKALRVRHELAHGGLDPVIMAMAVKSMTAEDYSNPEQLAMTEWLTSRHEFVSAQQAMNDALVEHFADVE